VKALAIVALLLGGVADADSDDTARRHYADGKAAFDARRFDEAYQHFKAAYLQSSRPELLFNMSRALEELSRPREAADALRAYLRVVPAEADRSALEQKIRALDEKQQILDADLRLTKPPVVEKPRRRTGLIAGLTVGGVVVVGLAVGLGIGLGLPAHTQSTLGAWQATR
jgi:tetratricopeptide (TPR) repeat protein